MNPTDFTRLKGLLSKLNAATNKASMQDDTFLKYYGQSASLIKTLPKEIERLQEALITAKIIQP